MVNWADVWARFTPSTILVYADFIDPFCYIGFHNVRLAAKNAKVALRWRGFELNPDTPEEGCLLQPAANSEIRVGMWESVLDFGKKSGLQLAEPAHVPNTRLAHQWVHSLADSDVKNSLIERIYQAYLSDKKNIGEPQILAGLADELGLPKTEIYKATHDRDASSLEKHRQEALRRRFPGMPGFVFKGKTLFGALSQKTWAENLT